MTLRRLCPRGSVELAAMAAVIVALASCAGPGGRGRADRDGPSGGRMAQMAAPILYSPNGEPLSGGPLGQPSCKLAMEYWLDRADSNHDGRLDRNEFLADARAQFARQDLDHLGYLTTDVLERYRESYRGSGRSAAHSGQDPVMAADADFDLKVTEDEFMKQAEQTFARLDADRDGAITKAELEAPCRQAAEAGARGDGGPPGGGQPQQRHGGGGGRRGGGSGGPPGGGF
jgi:hypothetical protein